MNRVGFGTTGTVEWITPDRQIFRFRTPFAGVEAMRGRLLDIRDFNQTPNTITLNWDTGLGRLLSVIDTAGDICTFNYPSGRLDSITYLGWTVNFTYDGNNRLATKSISGTNPTTYPMPIAQDGPSSTQRQFFYSTSAPTGLMNRVVDPRGKNDIQVIYDSFGRKTYEYDANNRGTSFKYREPLGTDV